MRRGKKSSMTDDKILRLEEIGVQLDPSGKFAEAAGGGGGGGGGKKNRKKKVCIHFCLLQMISYQFECKYVVCTCLSILYICALHEQYGSSHIPFLFPLLFYALSPIYIAEGLGPDKLRLTVIHSC